MYSYFEYIFEEQNSKSADESRPRENVYVVLVSCDRFGEPASTSETRLGGPKWERQSSNPGQEEREFLPRKTRLSTRSTFLQANLLSQFINIQTHRKKTCFELTISINISTYKYDISLACRTLIDSGLNVFGISIRKQYFYSVFQLCAFNKPPETIRSLQSRSCFVILPTVFVSCPPCINPEIIGREI